MATTSRGVKQERHRCVNILDRKIAELIHKATDPSFDYRQKTYLRRVIKLLRGLRSEIMELDDQEAEVQFPTGEFSQEEMDRAFAILEEMRNPFE